MCGLIPPVRVLSCTKRCICSAYLVCVRFEHVLEYIMLSFHVNESYARCWYLATPHVRVTSPTPSRYRVLLALLIHHRFTPVRCASCSIVLVFSMHVPMQLAQTRNTLKRYRIHYPGWDSNWDEWVSRDRLRWPVDSSYLSTRFRVRQVVEVWCTGTHVKGAWLQARVKQVRLHRSAIVITCSSCSLLQ